MARYTAAQLRKAWKPVMNRLGFQLERSLFVKKYGPITHSMCFQRSKWRREVFANLHVTIFDPFELNEAINERVCIHACLHRDGVYFKSGEWDENDLVSKASVFEQFGPPFFEQFQSIGSLIGLVEAAQTQFKLPEDYLRGPVPLPTDPVSREFLSLLPKARERPIPRNEELLALLYWHSGDKIRAVQHVRRYLELIPKDERMQLRLGAMTRPVN
jgi:hypothetical protein